MTDQPTRDVSRPDPTPPADAAPATCPRCGAANGCALAAGDSIKQCWCLQTPTLRPVPAHADANCYCARCLAEAAHAR